MLTIIHNIIASRFFILCNYQVNEVDLSKEASYICQIITTGIRITPTPLTIVTPKHIIPLQHSTF